MKDINRKCHTNLLVRFAEDTKLTVVVENVYLGLDVVSN